MTIALKFYGRYGLSILREKKRWKLPSRRKLRRFWFLFKPYLAWWRKHGLPKFPVRAVDNGEMSSEPWRRLTQWAALDTLRACWQEADHHVRGLPLPVLNPPRSPCEGCGAACCQAPNGVKGFTVVIVYPGEVYVKVHPEMVRPSDRRPGELQMLFDRETGRCQHLTVDNRCGIYATRPLSCRTPECLDELDPDWKGRTCFSGFLQERPEVRLRAETMLAEGKLIPLGLPLRPSTAERNPPTIMEDCHDDNRKK